MRDALLAIIVRSFENGETQLSDFACSKTFAKHTGRFSCSQCVAGQTMGGKSAGKQRAILRSKHSLSESVVLLISCTDFHSLVFVVRLFHV